MQRKQKGDCSLAELRDLGLSIDIDEVLARRLKGKLLIIDGHVRQGYYLGDSAFGCEHLHRTYDAIAEEVVHAATPDKVLEEMIPGMVHRYGQQQRWLPLMNLKTAFRMMEGSISEWQGRKLLMGPAAKPKLGRAKSLKMRERRLQRFIKQNQCYISAVRSAADVHKPDMQRWRHGKLSDESSISQRVESVFRGMRPIASMTSQG
jgi:hypothetical protein